MFCSRRLALSAAALLAASVPALANGYSHASGGGFGTISAKALGKSYAKYRGSAGYISQTIKASTNTSYQYGSILTGSAIATTKNAVNFGGCSSGCGNGSTIQIREKTEARTKTYAKGKNVLLKSRAKNYLSMHVDGKLWYENEQTSIAIGRHTPLGAQAASWARNDGTLSAKGKVRYSSGNVATSSVTVK